MNISLARSDVDSVNIGVTVKTTVNLLLKNYMHTQFRMQMTVRSQANRGNNFNNPPVIYPNVFEYFERCDVREARLKNNQRSSK